MCLASMLHYEAMPHVSAAPRPEGEPAREGNREYLKSGRGLSNINAASLPAVKAFLASQGIDCRHALSEATA